MLSLPIKYENNKFLISKCMNLQIYQNTIHILRKSIGLIIHCKEKYKRLKIMRQNGESCRRKRSRL